MIDPNDDFIDSWGIYTCLDYCAEGYFKQEDGTCGKCNGRCRICEGNADNCLYCLYEDNPYVGSAPTC